MTLNLTEGPYPLRLDDLLLIAAEKMASDVHLNPAAPPIVRINGELEPLDFPVLRPEDIPAMLFPILDPYQIRQLEEDWELDFSYSISGISRFRGNVMKQRGSLAVTFRLVPYQAPRIEDLGLPPVIRDLCFLPRGLILVTGATGSGKSTTLAGMINLINQHRRLNIVTVEDPIEFLHRNDRSVVKQREVGTDTKSFAEALRHVLRHDPDVILIGEMRDMESVDIALKAAETGHLVLSTLHTMNAPLSIRRVIDVFQDYMRSQIAQQVAGSIQAIVAQQLLPRADGRGRIVAAEVMLANPAIRNLIREGKEHQIYNAMQTSRHLGMQTMDQALADLCLEGRITREVAFQRCIDEVELERYITGKGSLGK
ncbi:MAG: type IV pilus twitching motility protein PilT [Candidatus Saccharibacteria bacterium]